MSADNYIYTKKLPNGEYAVGMAHASDPDEPQNHRYFFTNPHDAINCAHAWEQREAIVEYGVRLDDATFLDSLAA